MPVPYTWRKDKYEPEDITKLQYCYEEEVIANKVTAEEEELCEETELGEGGVDAVPFGLGSLGHSDSEASDLELDDDGEVKFNGRPKSKSAAQLTEELPSEDAQHTSRETLKYHMIDPYILTWLRIMHVRISCAHACVFCRISWKPASFFPKS